MILLSIAVPTATQLLSATRPLSTNYAAPYALVLSTVCQRILPGPEAAARAAAAASSKQRMEAEAAISAAVTDALHLLGALTAVLPLLTSMAMQLNGHVLIRSGYTVQEACRLSTCTLLLI